MISKAELLRVLRDCRTLGDAIYAKQEDIGYNVIVASTEPVNPGHWIKPDDETTETRIGRVVVSSSAPTDGLAAWIKTTD